jgi:ATP-dependent exoDNAse (exonuclease V) beta subunit
MTEIRPEFPFVLHHRNKLIDGTIDLLCNSAEGFAVFDYKFTECGESEAAGQYRAQMEIYRRAAEKCFPHAGDANTELIMISSGGVKRVPLVF